MSSELLYPLIEDLQACTPKQINHAFEYMDEWLKTSLTPLSFDRFCDIFPHFSGSEAEVIYLSHKRARYDRGRKPEILRRIKRVAISFNLLIDMVKTGWESDGRLRCRDGIPPDAVFIGSHTDNLTQCGYLVFYHPDFEPVEPNVYPETISVIMEKISFSAVSE